MDTRLLYPPTCCAVLSEAEEIGCSATELHAALMSVINRGHQVPKAFGFVDSSLRATMALGVLFGREEDDGQSATVPRGIVSRLVGMMFDILEGRSPSSPHALAGVLLCLSVSDANTRALIEPAEDGSHAGAGEPSCPYLCPKPVLVN
jgi:hypothetical protein